MHPPFEEIASDALEVATIQSESAVVPTNW
jgi:hypothetical protein